MATAETEVNREIRCLREPKIMYVTPLEDGTYSVKDLEHKNEYIISEEVFRREYEELY